MKILGALLVVIVVSVFLMRRIPSDIHVERVIAAPITKVWATWIDPELMKSWWSPKDFTAPMIQSDFRQNGKFLYSMRSAKGEMYWNSGTYTEIVPMQKIRLLMSFADENGTLVSGKDVAVLGR